MSLKILRTPELRGNNIRKEVIAWRNNLAVVLTRLTPIELQQFQPGLKQLLPEETGCKTQKGESPMKLTKWWQLGIMSLTVVSLLLIGPLGMAQAAEKTFDT